MKLEGKAREIDRRTYNNLHYSLRTKNGKADHCESLECNGISKTFEWALKKGREYSDNPDDYYQLCKSCHTKYDFKGKKSLSKETRKRMSLARIGVAPSNKGKSSKVPHKCECCNKDMMVYKSQGTKFCSRKCSGKIVYNLKNKKEC